MNETMDYCGWGCSLQVEVVDPPSYEVNGKNIELVLEPFFLCEIRIVFFENRKRIETDFKLAQRSEDAIRKRYHLCVVLALVECRANLRGVHALSNLLFRDEIHS